jgi:hypothetical protein
MGKRSNFERREADFYPTPRAAVVPLIPYLRGRGIRAFAEPCAGDGALVGISKGSACAVSMPATFATVRMNSTLRCGRLHHHESIPSPRDRPFLTGRLLHALINHFLDVGPC